MLAIICFSNLYYLKRTISNKFYKNKYCLFKILYNLSILIKKLEADLNYRLPEPSVKLYKDFIEVEFVTTYETLTIRSYVSTFDVFTNNKYITSCNYFKLKGLISKLYKIKERSLSFSLDALCPGLYIWCFNKHIIIGGDTCSSDYNYIVPTKLGFGIVLPNFIYWHTPFKYFKNIKI